MADRITREQRSRNMGRIRSKNTGPELAVRSLMHRMGLRFRLHDRTLPGTPDLVLRKHQTAVFVHGCFWHRHHGCPLCTTPSTNVEFWGTKFARNVARDFESRRALELAGWRVVNIWQCEFTDEPRLRSRILELFPHLEERAEPGAQQRAALR